MRGLVLVVIALTAAFGGAGATAENGPIAFTAGDELVVLDGGTESALANGAGGSWPAWSPDGTRIAFSSIRRGGIFVMNADGTGLRRVTRSPTLDLQAAWSPDGRRLAFARVVPGFNVEIFVVGVHGKGLRRLTFSRGQDSDPAWSPNGRRIAWTFDATSRKGAASGIYTMAPDGSGKRYRGEGSAPDWSPDGQRFVFAYDGDLWTSSVTGKEREPLSVAPAVDARPQWSPDGASVAFLSSQGSPTDQFRLWRVDVNGANRRLLTPGHESVSSFSWGVAG